MVLFKDFSSFGKKYLVVTKESNDTKEVDISMLVERPIIGRFAEKRLELKDSRDIVEWTYDVSWNSDSPSRAWSLQWSNCRCNDLRTCFGIFAMDVHWLLAMILFKGIK